MLSLFEIASLLLALSAFFGWINHVFFKLPHTIGLLVISLFASLSMLAAEKFFPSIGLTNTFQSIIGQIDFYSTVMEGMLAFLLFAGALHVNFEKMADHILSLDNLEAFNSKNCSQILWGYATADIINHDLFEKVAGHATSHFDYENLDTRSQVNLFWALEKAKKASMKAIKKKS